MQDDTSESASAPTKTENGRRRLSPQSSQVLSETGHDVRPYVNILRITSPGPDEGHPVLDSQYLSAKLGPTSSSAVASLVEDNGYGQQLADKEQVVNGIRDNLFDLSYTGAGLTIDEAHSRKLLITELSDAEESTSEKYPRPSRTLLVKSDISLDNALRAARLESVDKKKFLPLDRMDEIVTPSNIKQALESCIFGAEHSLDTLVRQIWCSVKITQASKGKTKTNRKRIFAILVRSNMLSAIVDVIAEDIYDADLPFVFDVNDVVFRHGADGEAPKIIKFFQDESKWGYRKRDLFETFQKEMTAPYFKLSWQPKKQVHHLTLAPTVVLPFVEETTDDFRSTRFEDFSGGTATVQKVQIHPAHHNYLGGLTSCKVNPCFAIKKLRMSEKSAKAEGKNLEYEALAMKRFVDKDHDHLIRLLATYTHGGYFHMILPCADGNLKNFWQTHVNPLFPARDSQMAFSVAKQCFGLARALESIHTSPVDASNHQKLDTVFRVKEHGRHGDLKPENILWFQLTEDNEARSPLGILKISDFGFADFHRTHSVNVIGRNAIGGITQTYRAPEYEVSNMISPAYDIWSFGCVLLQFAVWYVYGWEGIEKFSKRRAAEATNPIYQEDNFFNFDESSRKATEKLAVLQEFESLRNHHACSDFLLDMLDLIQTHLLRMKPKDRASCDEIVRKFETICANCKKDPKYCTERVKKIEPRSTNLSELIETVEYYLPQERGLVSDPINIVETNSIHVQVRHTPENLTMNEGTTTHEQSMGECLMQETEGEADETTPLINLSTTSQQATPEEDSVQPFHYRQLLDRARRLINSCIGFGRSGQK